MEAEAVKHLPDTELAVMKAIWACGEDVSRAEMEPHLTEYHWTANAINTYLTRLAEKGFVTSRKEGKALLYTPLVSRDEYLAFDSRRVLKSLYDGKPKNFLAALASGGIGKQDVAELRALLDELSGGENG